MNWKIDVDASSDRPLYRVRRHDFSRDSQAFPTTHIPYGVLTKRFHNVDVRVSVISIQSGWIIGCRVGTLIIQESAEVYKSSDAANKSFNLSLWSQKKFL